MSLKVLFISHSAGRTGAPLMLLAALRWIKRNTDLSFEILLKEGGDLHPQFAQLAPTRVLTKNSPSELCSRLYGRLRGRMQSSELCINEELLKYYRESGIRVIYANTIALGSILECLSSLRCQVITHVHELSHWIELCGKENLQQVKDQTSHFVAASNAVKRNLVENYGLAQSDVQVISSFLEIPDLLPDQSTVDRLRRSLGIEQGHSVVCSSGFETWRKGKDLFVQLGAILQQQKPDLNWRFLWVGGWESRKHRYQLRKQIADLGMRRQFLFVGEVDRPLEYFSLCDVFVITSREEPLGLVGLEASLVGKPIVCFKGSGGMPDFVEQDAGIAADEMDVESMASGVLQLISNPELAARLNYRAKEKIMSFHQVSVGAKAMVECIQTVIGGQGAYYRDA